MTIHRNLCAALAAAAWLALSAATANAAPAYVKSTVNLRSGTATTNDIVGRIPAGSLVEANNCSEWCEVTWQGKSGFAIKSALDTSGRVPPARRAVRGTSMATPYDDDDDEVVVDGPVYYGAPVVTYPYPYYRPYGYYRFRGYGYRYGGWRRRW
jgi:uncharacterized protein YgiM (DUF1202 family)